MGGEKTLYKIHHNGYFTSPPHGRGKDDNGSRAHHLKGITPAWAGKSRQILDLIIDPEDHPRVGGEKLRICCLLMYL